MLPDDYQNVAAQIDTGISDPETSRALIVFNHTDRSLDGAAVFRAEMAWPADTSLPPVVISELGGAAVPSVLTDWHEGPDQKGRAAHRHISFVLRFAVQDVPAQGWRTYIATYSDTLGPVLPETQFENTPGLVVVETLRHEGSLPPVFYPTPRPGSNT
jgi:hypothetical protein